MFRKRARLLAAALGLAALGMVVANWRTVWLTVAYEHVSAEYELSHYRKKSASLPGAAFVITEQVCPACDRGDHRHCLRKLVDPESALIGEKLLDGHFVIHKRAYGSGVISSAVFASRTSSEDYSWHHWRCLCEDPH